jgi:hypothetical protein
MVHDPERPRGLRWPARTPTQADLASDLPRPLQPDSAPSHHLASDVVPWVADLRNLVTEPTSVAGTERLHPGLAVNRQTHVHNLVGALCPHLSPLLRGSMANYGRPGAAWSDWICHGADDTLTELPQPPVRRGVHWGGGLTSDPGRSVQGGRVATHSRPCHSAATLSRCVIVPRSP